MYSEILVVCSLGAAACFGLAMKAGHKAAKIEHQYQTGAVDNVSNNRDSKRR